MWQTKYASAVPKNLSTKVLYMSKNTLSSSFAQFVHFLKELWFFDLSWEISCVNVKKHIIVIFVIQKLENKYISLKKYTDWAILGHVTENLEFWFQRRKCAPMYYLNLLKTAFAICSKQPLKLYSTTNSRKRRQMLDWKQSFS